MGLFPTPELQRNPWPMYQMLRQSQPAFYLEQYDIWLVFRYDDVRTVLSDHANFSSRFGDMQGSAEHAGPGASLITLDPPRHTQLRSLVTRAFTPRAVAALEPRIEAITNELLDNVIGTGRMDLVEDLSYPLPVIVIAEMLGIPASDRDQFKHWSDLVVASADQSVGGTMDPASRQASDDMYAYFRTIITARRSAPKDDLISALLAAEIEGEKLSEADVLNFCWLLLVAGNETTTNLISNAVLTFLEHPEALARLRANPELLPGAIEEVLRYRSPVQCMFRIAAKDVEIAGKAIKQGSRLLAFIGSANRDEAKFADPDVFLIERDPNPHIAFGMGMHFCLGAPLARLEARVVLSTLLRRLADVARVDDAPLEPARGMIVHGVTHLPLRFTPAAPATIS